MAKLCAEIDRDFVETIQYPLNTLDCDATQHFESRYTDSTISPCLCIQLNLTNFFLWESGLESTEISHTSLKPIRQLSNFSQR